MNKICARCDKTVYPIEELKCLDKSWHKTCFKCYECNMILNMKTYKGFNKNPYCNAHCPQARATTVVDTPETRRLAENTKIQSQVKYHEQFERQKGKLTQVADDPETLRIRNTSKIISNVSYHGEYEKKKQMEERRTLLNTDSNVVNNNIHQMVSVMNNTPHEYTAVNNNLHHSNNTNLAGKNVHQNDPNYGNINANSKQNREFYQINNTKVPSSNYMTQNANYNPRYSHPQTYNQMTQPNYAHQQQHQQQQQRAAVAYQEHQYYNANSVNPKPVYGTQNLGRCFRAIYDYTAQDTDEVSFVEGDMLVHCQPIDDGWMNGTVQRTGQTGMLPSNYVESA